MSNRSNRDTKIATTPQLVLCGVSSPGAFTSPHLTGRRWICGHGVRWLVRKALKSGTKLRLQISKQPLPGGRRVYIGQYKSVMEWDLHYSSHSATWSREFPGPVRDDAHPLHEPLSRFIYKSFRGLAKPERFYVRLVIVK